MFARKGKYSPPQREIEQLEAHRKTLSDIAARLSRIADLSQRIALPTLVAKQARLLAKEQELLMKCVTHRITTEPGATPLAGTRREVALVAYSHAHLVVSAAVLEASRAVLAGVQGTVAERRYVPGGQDLYYRSLRSAAARLHEGEKIISAASEGLARPEPDAQRHPSARPPGSLPSAPGGPATRRTAR